MDEIVKKIEQEKIIAIVRGVAKDKIIPLAQAMYRGGVRLIECTFDASDKISEEETASNIEMLVKYFGAEMVVGAGTVLTEKQVELTKEAGGRFIISPDTNIDVVKKTRELGLVSIPGALTPSEITLAVRNGANFVKIFPVSAVGGMNYVKAVSAPLSHVKFLAVGGVNVNNVADYLRAGFQGVGIGNGIVNTKMVANDDYDGITKLAAEFISKIKES